MKKVYTLLIALFAIVTLSAQSAGIYENYIILKISNESSNSYYDLNASTANPDFNGTNLGSFYTASSLIIVGGQNKTYKCDGGDITGGSLFYRVFRAGTNPNSAGAFMEIPMTWVSDDSGAGTGCQNQTWEGTTGTTNIISGLSPGDYQIEAYTSASTNLGTVYSNNNGDNFIASFSITDVLSAADFAGPVKKYVVADGKLLSTTKGNLDITIYDFNGKILKTMMVKANGNAIDLKITQRGIYLAKISDGNSFEVVKFVR